MASRFGVPIRRIALTCALGALSLPVSSQVAKEELASSNPVYTPAEIDNTLEVGGEDIDAAKTSSRMTVEVAVNGTGPYRFIVDSGADTSVIGTRIAKQLGLPSGSGATLNSMTEIAPVDRVMVDSLTLGPTTTQYLELPVLDEADIGAAGMIGLDALVEQRLMMDFEERAISVDDARTVKPTYRGGEIVVTARLYRGQLILTRVLAGSVALDAVIDTGTEISIGNGKLRDRLLRRHQKFEEVEIIGVTGKPAVLELAYVKHLRIGPITLSNVPIAFADVPPFEFFGINEGPALLLGTDIMETFRKVSLDFHARKVRFQLSKCAIRRNQLRTSTGIASRIASDPNVPGACNR